MRKAVIDLDTNEVLEVDGKIRKGECRQCGKCCLDDKGKPCEYLYTDSCADETRTQLIYACRFAFDKPFGCVIWPLPENMIKGCGYYWEDK
jgi:hypothetical protein